MMDPGAKKLLKLYNNLQAQEQFFGCETDELMCDNDPENPIDGFYFTQAFIWKDQYLHLKQEVTAYRTLASTYETGLTQIQQSFEAKI